jgi:arginase
VLSLISAPSNLGLRPPEAGSVPGTAKAPEALREAGLLDRLGSVAGIRDAGIVLPGRYRVRADAGQAWNQAELIDHATRLSERIGREVDQGASPLVIGGDCSLLVGAGVALSTRGRFGLVHLDGHTDFRHPGNSDECGYIAGEDLAAAIGLHWDAIADIKGRRPYFRAGDSVHVGCRSDDDHLAEVRQRLPLVFAATDVKQGPAKCASQVSAYLADLPLDGYWVHLDVDILDPVVMPAVDSPSPGGLSAEQLVEFLEPLAAGAAGAEVTIFDPDLDPDGTYASRLVDVLVRIFGAMGQG